MSTAIMSDDAKAVVELVQKKYQSAESVHKARCDRWVRWYRLYRSRQEFKRTHADARGPRDVDAVLQDARGVFGADLFIPYVFSVIETTLPRMLSQNPKMNLTPAPVWPGAVPNLDMSQLEEHANTLKLVYDRYQTKMQYPLVTQDVAKSGLINGLGVGKMLWCDEMQRSRPQIVRDPSGNGYMQGAYDKIVYRGPKAEAVDIYDWITDPTAYDMASMGWSIHRMWRGQDYIRKQFETGVWQLPEGVELEDILSAGSDAGRTAEWASRQEAAGNRDAASRLRGQELHEVWEFNDGEWVYTIINRAVPVQSGPNPHWSGEQPFAIYRPTKVPHELVGIGEPEAIEDLQEEMNTLRSQRRDNASLVLQRPFAYFDGLADIGDFEFGPGAMWPVDGDPRELIFPIPLQDIPGSSYQEEAALQADIERVSGINDMEAGGDGGSAGSTATGAQLIHAAANVRIANKTFLLTTEMMTPQAQQMLDLLQQFITDHVYIPGPPRPGENGAPWSYYLLTPEVLAGDWLVEADGGTMAPDNVPQMRDDATRMWNMFGQDALVDPVRTRVKVLENLGIKDAQAWVKQPETQVPLSVVQQAVQIAGGELQQAGVDPASFDQHMEMLVAQLMQANQEQQNAGAAAGRPALPPGAGQPPQGAPAQL